VDDHLDDRRDTATLVADAVRGGLLEPDLRGGVRAIAELVLEPVDPERVVRSVVEDPWEEEARQPAGCLREDEEGVAHRSRAEPLVAGQQVFVAVGLGPGLVGADVGASLTLGHRHPAERAALVGVRAETGVVLGRGEEWLPRRGKVGSACTERRHGRVRHRQRAADPGLGVRERHEERSARDVGAGARLAPRERV
jgi:hypothetical protein